MTESAALADLATELRRSLGSDALITDEVELRTYECDGLSHLRATPGLVVLARDLEAVRKTIVECTRRRVPFVARGAGTGLSGGALPRVDGVLIVLAKMRDVIEIDIKNQRAVLEPGVTNTEITLAAAPMGYFYAPDPSSQQVCTIGGNVAENSGGAHCLKHGFTAHHVTGLELVTPDGDVLFLGGKSLDPVGYDLIGAIVGSEGTLGVATKVTVRLQRDPESVRTLLAGFESIDHAAHAVSSIIADGIVPAAIEMMDALAITAAEAAVACQYPVGAGAILIVELDGPRVDVEIELSEVRAHFDSCGAFEIRLAESERERAEIWKGRKSAFAAVGRISPDYIVQDGVVPRSVLPEVLAQIRTLADSAGIRVANVFHAGDGNLHPLILFDASRHGEQERAVEVSEKILELCVANGGSITGEHGVGFDKMNSMSKMFGPDDLDAMQRIRCAFDPQQIANPGKIFPTPRLCGEIPRVHHGSEETTKRESREIF